MPEVTLPFFIKPKYAGARLGTDGLAVINTVADFECWDRLKNSKYSSFVAQTYVNEDGIEYSSAVSFNRDGEIKDLIVTERKKVEGLAMMAEYSPDLAKIESIIKTIAAKIKGLYAFNIQFKMKV